VIAATPPSIFLFCTSQRPAFQPSLFTQERPPALADRRPSCYRDAALLDPSFDGQIKLLASSFKLLESRPESGWARLAPDRCRSVSLRARSPSAGRAAPARAAHFTFCRRRLMHPVSSQTREHRRRAATFPPGTHPSSRLRAPSAAFASPRLKNPRLPIQNPKFKIQSPAPVRR
jgi:hypothetical protein